MKERGFTLFIAITLTATLLLIAAGIVSLAVRQSLISVSGRESQHAFYAADTGMECALYWDIKNPSGSSAFKLSTGSQISCNNQIMTVGGNAVSTFSFNLSPDPYCATVTVTKTGGSGPGLPTSQTFNSSTTWTAPAGVTSVMVEIWGSGGGGGSNDSGGGAGGGGGGAYSLQVVSVTPGNNYTVTIGTAGRYQPGGDSWFSTTGTVLAKGGGDGRNASASAPGNGAAGGAASGGIGTAKWSGGNGATGFYPAGPGTGGGGGSAYTTANGGNASGSTGGAGTGAGGTGNESWGFAPGGGGAGGGGAGAAGRVVLSYTANGEDGITTIESRGYNTCSALNPRRVERAVRAIY